jgi:hypothetical protein
MLSLASFLILSNAIEDQEPGTFSLVVAGLLVVLACRLLFRRWLRKDGLPLTATPIRRGTWHAAVPRKGPEGVKTPAAHTSVRKLDRSGQNPQKRST